MGSMRKRQRNSWSNDPKLDREIKQKVMRNNLFAVIVIIIIMGGLFLGK